VTACMRTRDTADTVDTSSVILPRQVLFDLGQLSATVDIISEQSYILRHDCLNLGNAPIVRVHVAKGHVARSVSALSHPQPGRWSNDRGPVPSSAAH